MAKIAKDLTELIGNTPLVYLANYSAKKGLGATVIAKLESFNPAGCVKERIALSMIEDAEKAGILKAGVEIIEPTISVSPVIDDLTECTTVVIV